MRWIAALAICLVTTTAWADWGARRDPFDPSTVSRIKALLVRDPYDEGALRQLVALYRGHRTVAQLEAEYRKQLDAGESWSALVVLARLPNTDALALWNRAVALKPDDARGWIAVGDAARTDAAVASAAYRHAASVATKPQQKQVALTRLVAAAREPAVIDNAYAELIALAPKDGKLWLDRGNARLAAKQYEGAHAAFVAAEPLLRTDPERRLTAMTSQGIALDALGRSDDALAQYEHTLDNVPRGHYLGQEIVLRIVDTERKRKRLDAAITRLEKRWPERTRGYLEWSLLGELYQEQQRDELAIDAYQRAVTKSPTEVATQRRLIALLDKVRPTSALAHHEIAARFAPGDAGIQIELAKRYRSGQPEKAIATLVALSRRLAGNVGVRTLIAALYEEWEEPVRALVEYEAIVKLEPNDPDHAIVLGEALWRAGQTEKAHAAWNRLDKIATAESLFRHGEVLALHDEWAEAEEPYTKSLAIDPKKADTLYGRARVHEALDEFPQAIDDALRAVALTHDVTLETGLRDRTLLVRVLGKAYEAGDQRSLDHVVGKWRFAFEHGELGAGYLLAAHHNRIRSPQHHDVLVELARRAPNDDSLGLALARSYVHHREFAKAKKELERVAKHAPDNKDLADMVHQIDGERARLEREIRLAEEGTSSASGDSPDLVGRSHRYGLRFWLGTDVRETSGAHMGIGIYRTHRITNGLAWSWRLDWSKHDDDMQVHKAFAVAGGVTARILDARTFELAAGLGPRFEFRYGDSVPSDAYGDGAIGGDATLDLMVRGVPSTLAMRFHQSFTDDARSSALFVELGFEWR